MDTCRLHELLYLNTHQCPDGYLHTPSTPDLVTPGPNPAHVVTAVCHTLPS
eukprot:m.71142 g.71142  ORF g.71142 m.71142 type:complete len:51 (+) comp8687_c0_seq1:1564-1716(+)